MPNISSPTSNPQAATVLTDEIVIEVSISTKPERYPHLLLLGNTTEDQKIVCSGDPDGIRTHDLQRDRLAC